MQELGPVLVILFSAYVICAFIPTLRAWEDMFQEFGYAMEYFRKFGFSKREAWPLKDDRKRAVSFLKYAFINLLKVIFYLSAICVTWIIYASWCQ